MPLKEKARQDAEPIPNAVVCQDSPEFKTSPLKLQTFCLARRFALSAPLAEAIAPLLYAEVWR